MRSISDQLMFMTCYIYMSVKNDGVNPKVCFLLTLFICDVNKAHVMANFREYYMPAHPTTQVDLNWLEATYKSNSMTLRAMATEAGCCVDTLKRILNREGIAIYSAAKYQTSSRKNAGTWQRPCMKCGSSKSRPKWQYICTPCKETQADESPFDW